MQEMRHDNSGQSDRFFPQGAFRVQRPELQVQGTVRICSEDSDFIDSQDLRIQERPEDLPPEQLPRTLGIKLVGKEIVDIARPGDHISAVGPVRAMAPTLPGVGKLRTFNLHLDANSIEVLGKEPESAMPSPEEEEKILDLAKDPWIQRKIISSIAPSIYGYDHVKEAIMYLLFGGVPKNLPDIAIRGEMNALLVGDPGTAGSCSRRRRRRPRGWPRARPEVGASRCRDSPAAGCPGRAPRRRHHPPR